ncbi:MAG TPA: translation elongation factor 4 [Candidatus Nanoarchaeia archaeon]|nr:translation elongation factor 4 [Candidatus Nanoarchaeia archaeon]
MKNIRNFCIIAHIDHGKSTFSDRLLELTGTIEKRKMREQFLDKLDLERERGITIKLKPVTMRWEGYVLNLIDTPGHVDFSYEVSRSLAAVEGAILLIDATQGIQAQTLANLYLAMNENLTVIPVINKIDLPAADVPKVKQEIIHLLGCPEEEILLASGKTGAGVEKVLREVIAKVPPPDKFVRCSDMQQGKSGANPPRSAQGGPPPACRQAGSQEGKPTRALIFDSNYDEYKGVVAHIRVMDGAFKKGDKIKLYNTKTVSEALDVGIFNPEYQATGELGTGEVGYIVTSFKNVSECGVGDTVTTVADFDKIEPLKGYTQVKPMVFAGVFPREGDDFQQLREAMDRLKLNDASLSYEPEHSEALGFGFRCGFLGLLHLEIFQERLSREFNLNLIVTVPSVAYKVFKRNGEEVIIRTPQKLPGPTEVEHIEEPWVALDVVVPKDYIGKVMELAIDKKGIYKNTEYLDESRVILHYDLPMASILTDFYDKIKSASSGFASINYEFLDYRPAKVVRLDILVAEEPIEALSTIVYEDEAFRAGRAVVEILKDTLPRQMFVVKLQAAVQGKIIAAERLSALRKDVTAKLYGGDVSRKRKLLEKQKKGKKKMMAAGKGSVEIPPETFVKILKK